ncbi:hypothetical protein A0J61_10064 [Choanephora cucurbitarum]|uniref:Uncharacterized protein n=1 Tax=Choanephora cucurbitarum TaxID=101091 RepID=A0A1C7MYH7_9FUNG|nr:hypothetical protein A0J61_10064 [Choanephora cucurbitarum]
MKDWEEEEEEAVKKMVKILTHRHLWILGEDRPELDAQAFSFLTVELLKSSLKKRKRDEKEKQEELEKEEQQDKEEEQQEKEEQKSASSSTLNASMTTATITTNDNAETVGDNWLLCDYNISGRFDELRTRAMDRYNSNKNTISCLDKLLLNHIMFVSESHTKSTLKFFPERVRSMIFESSKQEVRAIPSLVNEWVSDLNKIIRNGAQKEKKSKTAFKHTDVLQKALKAKAWEFEREAREKEDEELAIYASILSHISKKVMRWSSDKLGETTFIHNKLTDVLDCVFGSLNAAMFHYEMQDKFLSNICLKPDYLLTLRTSDGENLELYTMEAKVPEAHKGDVDFVKTSIMLKYMLDELISRGCSPEEAMVFGTLLRGNQIFQYQMSLRHSGIYMMQEVFVGFLPTSSKEIDRLVSLVPMMMDIMATFDKQAEMLEALPSKRKDHPFQRPTAFKLKIKGE